MTANNQTPSDPAARTQQVEASTYKVLGRENEELTVARDINLLSQDIGAWAKAKGFWNAPKRLEELMAVDSEVRLFMDGMRKSQKGYLMVSELGEHCEVLRKQPGDLSVDTPGFTNETVEIADLIIRALDYCGQYELPIGDAIMAKMAKNQKRPYQHGKKF